MQMLERVLKRTVRGTFNQLAEEDVVVKPGGICCTYYD